MAGGAHLRLQQGQTGGTMRKHKSQKLMNKFGKVFLLNRDRRSHTDLDQQTLGGMVGLRWVFEGGAHVKLNVTLDNAPAIEKCPTIAPL